MTSPVAKVLRLSDEGRGIAEVDGKIVFIEGALPEEEVSYRTHRKRARFDDASVEQVLQVSPQRVTPGCVHFDNCGGCSLQHLDHAAQVLHKQEALLSQLSKAVGGEPASVLAPISGLAWGYRRKARLGVKHVHKKGGALVGFREKRSSKLAVLESCRTLHPSVGERILALRTLVSSLSVRARLPQIEIAVGDARTALLIRHLDPLTAVDQMALTSFAIEQDLDIYLQPGGPDTVHAHYPEAPVPLYYRLPEHDVTIQFHPADFIQVNGEVNRSMVNRVVEIIRPEASDVVADFYCGVGNFTLPLARYVGAITGIELSTDLVGKAIENAESNQLTHARFQCFDLETGQPPELPPANKIVLDPPRAGAFQLLQQLDISRLERLVYVSCNPATLARDADLLVNERGLSLVAAGVMDMFPHTSHVESMAVFENTDRK